MSQIGIDARLEPGDVKQLNRWVADGKFVDLADAIQSAVHTAVNIWRFDEFVEWERETYGGMTDAEFNEAIAEEGMVPYVKPAPPPPAPAVRFVAADDDEYIGQSEDPDDSESEWESVWYEEVRSRLRYLIQQRRWSCHKIAEHLAWDGFATSDAAVDLWYRGQQRPSDPDAVLDSLNQMLEE